MKANTPRRTTPILIYLLPAMADMIVAQYMFINAVRLARSGASASVVANTVTVWSIVYLLACPVIGRFVTAGNAARLMVGSMVGLATMGVLFTVFPGVVAVYILMAFSGIATALFFLPFQVFMKAVDRVDSKPLTYSTGLYTFSWSAGFAVGPFVSGFLMERGSTMPGGGTSGWKYAFLFAVAAALLNGVGVLRLKHLRHGQAGAPATEPEMIRKPVTDYSGKPDLAWLGWVGGGVGVILITLIRAVFPARAEAGLHLGQSLQGLLFFLMSLSQALTGLALCRSRYWMYRPVAVAGFGVLGLLGTLAFGFAESPLILGAGSVLFGVYSGSFFFYLVFHALIHPHRSSHYVAINESVVGVCGMAGAVVGGWVADRFGFGTLYTGGAAMLFLTLLFQCGIHRQANRLVSG